MTTDNKKPNTVQKQTFEGMVVSDKMKDTAVIEILRYVKHPKYHKFIMRKTKIAAHNPGNTKKIGDKATVQSCRPISKSKSFKVIA
jgi:small subunit ribosomal protein S17